MDWRNRSACLDEDPELFFPIGNTGPAILQIEEAKQVCRRCDGWTLLDGLNGLGQTYRLRFETLQAGIKQLLVDLLVHRLVAESDENAEADQPEPHQALQHHGGDRATGRLRGIHGWPPETEGIS